MHPGVFEYLKLKLYMRKSRKRRILFIILAIPILAVFVFSILFLTAEDPPIASINMSQAAISQAKEAEAAQYVPRLLVAAETANQMAVDEWKFQNELISFNRDFSKMRALAQEATEKANFARESAIHVKDSLQTSLTGRLETVKNKLNADNIYAYQQGLEMDITNAVIRRLQQDGTVKVTTQKDADVILKTDLVSLDQEGLRFNSLEGVSQYRLFINVRLRLEDAKAGDTIWEESNFSGGTEYYVTTVTSIGMQKASEDAVTNLAYNIVNRVVEDW